MKSIGVFTILFLLTCSWGMYSKRLNLPLPEKKLTKAIAKVWKEDSVTFEALPETDCLPTGRMYAVTANGEKIGQAYVGRAFTCRQNGCTLGIVTVEQSEGFEYYDFFALVKNGEVSHIQITDYQATHGQEVSSKGWLKQFVGFKGERELNYGKEIDALSGATISARSMISNIEQLMACYQE